MKLELNLTDIKKMSSTEINNICSMFPDADPLIVTELFKELGSADRVIDRLINNDEYTKFKSKNKSKEPAHDHKNFEQKPRNNLDRPYQHKPRFEAKHVEQPAAVKKPKQPVFSSSTQMTWGEIKADKEGNLIDGNEISTPPENPQANAQKPTVTSNATQNKPQIPVPEQENPSQKQTRLFAIPDIANTHAKINLFGEFSRRGPSKFAAQ